MKKLLFIMLVFASGLQAQNIQATAVPNTTGDEEMDGIVKEMNAKAQTDMNAFVNEVSTTCSIPKKSIDDASKTMNAGDVFMAAQVAKASNKPFEEVTKSFQANKGKGWGEIAKEMGIQPGSPEFHRMKSNMKGQGGNANGHGKAKKELSKANGSGNDGNGNGKGKTKKDMSNASGNGNSGNTSGKGKAKKDMSNAGGTGNSGNINGNTDKGSGQGKDKGKN